MASSSNHIKRVFCPPPLTFVSGSIECDTYISKSGVFSVKWHPLSACQHRILSGAGKTSEWWPDNRASPSEIQFGNLRVCFYESFLEKKLSGSIYYYQLAVTVCWKENMQQAYMNPFAFSSLIAFISIKLRSAREERKGNQMAERLFNTVHLPHGGFTHWTVTILL